MTPTRLQWILDRMEARLCGLESKPGMDARERSRGARWMFTQFKTALQRDCMTEQEKHAKLVADKRAEARRLAGIGR